MFRFAHPELLYLLIVIPLLIVFYVIMTEKKKKAIAAFGNPELLKPLMPLLSFKRGVWKFVMWMFALFFVIYAWTRFLVSKNDPFKMRAIFASAATYFMISIPFCTIVEVYQMNDSYNMIFLYLLLVTKIGDIAAYVTGSLSGYFLRNHGGNHKMIPSISPGKSYDGAVGGFIFTLLLSYFLWPFCGIECTVFDPFWASMILGVLLFFGCMAGDLSESAFKRTCKIKDSGAILPGIGGMLDLVDSLIVTGPLFFLFLLIFTDFKI